MVHYRQRWRIFATKMLRVNPMPGKYGFTRWA
jgi:hypothetical protein